jgi:Mn2+/Fe2+ NRAMP family transporter
MMAFLEYDVKVAVLIAVFYTFYRLLLAKDSFHRLNRVVLLLTAVLSFTLPVCVITFHRTMVVKSPAVSVETPVVKPMPNVMPSDIAHGAVLLGDGSVAHPQFR